MEPQIGNQIQFQKVQHKEVWKKPVRDQQVTMQWDIHAKMEEPKKNKLGM